MVNSYTILQIVGVATHWFIEIIGNISSTGRRRHHRSVVFALEIEMDLDRIGRMNGMVSGVCGEAEIGRYIVNYIELYAIRCD